MKKILLLMIMSVLLSHIGFTQTRVKGYLKKNGTYVQTHIRSKADNSPYNNYKPQKIKPYKAPKEKKSKAY